ncbi:1-phosphofructokinase [Candidatus Magnetobacterium bavaricum]|uniref:1-phosphofructokinase n=1 Tax=Candidatus Magnetobacterium bavaricum TaxID=29290 RepID=A0A0F3GU00_9BACT|nr:1-phosphofructokinase [Candidatus Magnetobacterium bavaricum]
MIITVTLNPSIDRTLRVDDFRVGGINRGQALMTCPGGKGINVSRAVARMGVEGIALGLVGGRTGGMIVEMLRHEGVDFRYVEVGQESRNCYGILDETNATETILNELGPVVSDSELSRFKALYAETVIEGAIVVLSGSMARGMADDLYAELISIAHHKQARVLLDTSGRALDRGIAALPDFLKINAAELNEITGRVGSTLEETTSDVQRLLNLGISAVVITRGRDDALAFTADTAWRVTPPQVAAVNTWGSGDCVVAGMAVALANNTTLQQALRLAIASGTANTLCYGAGFISMAKVNELAEGVVIRDL